MRVKLLCLVVGVALASSAVAFVPVVSYLLGRHVQARAEGNLTHLKVVLETTLHRGGGQQRAIETVWYAAPWKARSELVLDEGTRVRIRNGTREWTELPDGSTRRGRARIDLVSDFFAAADTSQSSGKERLLRILTSLGVDSGKRVLTRYDGRIAVLIGADPWEKTTPQVWLDKDAYFPLRFIYKEKGADGDRLVDIRLLGYGGAKVGSWYPEVVEVWVDGALQRRSVVESIEVGATEPKDAFRVK